MSFIQNLFTSRDNNAQGNTYVGQQDRIWWDPDTNAFFYSDGNTAGGIPIGTASGSGIPIGPINSVQLNAGSGNFLGTSSLTFSGNVLTVGGNVLPIISLVMVVCLQTCPSSLAHTAIPMWPVS
jgi:hypothetical protein